MHAGQWCVSLWPQHTVLFKEVGLLIIGTERNVITVKCSRMALWLSKACRRDTQMSDYNLHCSSWRFFPFNAWLSQSSYMSWNGNSTVYGVASMFSWLKSDRSYLGYTLTMNCDETYTSTDCLGLRDFVPWRVEHNSPIGYTRLCKLHNWWDKY